MSVAEQLQHVAAEVDAFAMVIAGSASHVWVIPWTRAHVFQWNMAEVMLGA